MLRPCLLHAARRKEAPFIIKALQARTHTEAQAALNEGRAFIEASRRLSLWKGQRP